MQHTLQHTATLSTTLEHAASAYAHKCDHTATHGNTGAMLMYINAITPETRARRTATLCNTLQHPAALGSTGAT